MLPRRRFFDDLDELAEWDDGAVRVDVYDDEKSIGIEATIPSGIPEDKIDVSVKNGRLTIKGEVKKEEEEKKDRKYYKKEITYMSFNRSIDLPVSVVADKAKASFKDGILKIEFPKSEEAKEKKIKLDVKSE